MTVWKIPYSTTTCHSYLEQPISFVPCLMFLSLICHLRHVTTIPSHVISITSFFQDITPHHTTTTPRVFIRLSFLPFSCNLSQILIMQQTKERKHANNLSRHHYHHLPMIRRKKEGQLLERCLLVFNFVYHLCQRQSLKLGFGIQSNKLTMSYVKSYKYKRFQLWHTRLIIVM